MHDMGIISKIKSKLSYKEVTPLYMDDLLRDAYQTTSVVGGSLKGRIALVTGATSGIGFAIAERLLGEGCRVIISGRNVQKLQTAVAELKRRSCKANDDTLSTLLLNQYDAEAVRNSVDGLFSTAPVSIVINNAGFLGEKDHRCEFRSVTEEEYFRTIDVNLKSTILISELAAARMAQYGGGIFSISVAFVGSHAIITIPLMVFRKQGSFGLPNNCLPHTRGEALLLIVSLPVPWLQQ